MSLQTWQELLNYSGGDGPALTASIVATSIAVPTKLTLPVGFWVPGKKLRVTTYGRISTVVTTPGTLTLDVRMGAVIAHTSQALALNIVAKTNVLWKHQVVLQCRSIGPGTGTTLLGLGDFTSEAVIGSPLPTVGGSGVLMIPASAPAVGTGFDSTLSQVVDLFATWSISNANSIQVHDMSIEAMN
jgi:hypothetical protein